MKTLEVTVGNALKERNITIHLSPEDYETLMSIYDDELGIEFSIIGGTI